MAQARTEEQYTAHVFDNALGAEQAAVEAWTADMEIETATPRRGRKPIVGRPGAMGSVSAEVVEAAQAAAPAIAEIRANTVSMPKAELVQSLHLAKTVGSIAAFQFNEAVNRVATLKAFAEIRESKVYKGLSVQNTAGDVVTVNTWEEFCNAHGYSHSKIAEDLQNLAAFGGSLLEAQEALGLGYRDLRLLRAGITQLPPEEQKAVREKMKNTEAPEELRVLIGELETKITKANKRIDELGETIKTKERTSKEYLQESVDLREKVALLTSMAPSQQARARDEANAQAAKDVDAACHALRLAALNLRTTCAAIRGDERSTVDTCTRMDRRVSFEVSECAQFILNAGITVDFRKEFMLPGPDDLPAEEYSAEPEPANPA